MNKPLFSIILPIYKVEKYISKCISTCCNQKGIEYAKYELILVDDLSILMIILAKRLYVY